MSSSGDVDYRLVGRLLEGMVRRHSEEPLRHGTGDGSGGGMEHRISRLEGQFDRLSDKMDNLGDRLSSTEKDMATVKERLLHMPTKFEFYTALVVMTGVLTLVGTVISRFA